MNHKVPDFLQMDDVCSMPTHSRSKKSTTGGEGVTELLWENGHVVMQSQRPPKMAVGDGDVMIPAEREVRLGGEEQHLFMQEHEMTSWLQYPLDDLYADLLSPPPPAPISTITQPRVVAEIPSPPPPRPPNVPRLQSFGNFSRLSARPRSEPMNLPLVTASRESTVVESNKTPTVRPPEPRVNVESGTATCEQTVTSSFPSGSRASFCASGEAHQPQQRPEEAAEDRKRKARENDDNEYQSEDTELEAAEAKKAANGSTSTKRTRAAKVHNLSERKRRDRINERMKALQELIPRCNKSDKASMLDEAIEYLKSLQMQVQLMSMGYPMVPMMYPGMQQQYMPAMGLGMGMNQPMVPYHTSMLPSSSTLNPAHMGSTFPMPAPFPMTQVHMPDPRTQVSSSNQANHAVNFPQYQNQPGMPNFVDPYQQYVGMYQGQYPIPQNHGVSQPGPNKPSTSKDIGNQP